MAPAQSTGYVPDPISDTLPASPDEDPTATRQAYQSQQSVSTSDRPQYHRPQVKSVPPAVNQAQRSRGYSTASISSVKSVRRKPLPATASPIATRFSQGQHFAKALHFDKGSEQDLPTLPNLRRDYNSLDSPTVPDFPRPPAPVLEDQEESSDVEESFNFDAYALTAPTTPGETDLQPQSTQALSNTALKPLPLVPGHRTTGTTDPTEGSHTRLTSDTDLRASDTTGPWHNSEAEHAESTMPLFSNKPTPPHFTLTEDDSHLSNKHDSPVRPNPPATPESSRLRTFFGWGGSPASPTPSPSFSQEKPLPLAPSPDISPIPISRELSRSSSYRGEKSEPAPRSFPAAIDVPKANANADNYFGNYLSIPSSTSAASPQVDEMEDELKAISTELAASIRREMDLEDLVERLQAEAANPEGQGRRTSDYFSDSGISSIKYGETDARTEELERLQRKTEQEKASIRLELTNKVHEERSRRKELEAQIRSLEEKASKVDLIEINSMDANGRLKDLENTCEDLRRRLSEKRQVKENFEDLLKALKSELQTSSNERDNLKDEIVPQLRARVEGLEAQAAEHEKLTYESSKMQQELQSLKNENMTLVNARKTQLELQTQMHRISAIAEDTPISSFQQAVGLSRSASLARRPPQREASLSRSSKRDSLQIGGESRDSLAERIKDVELQRDSLHRALKSLLERQELQSRENEKKIRQLELERDRALSNRGRRRGFNKDVEMLREEINTLRRRAENAIEQKWQCEKNLGGLKMDLDRAEQEISSLRTLLLDNDILIPEDIKRGSGSELRGSPSEGLERSYQQLQQKYAESLERIRELEDSFDSDDTSTALSQWKNSLSNAISERNFSISDTIPSSLDDSELDINAADESALAEELRKSAARVKELAAEVRQQLSHNAVIRQRLADTIERGEREQRDNANRITYMQGKLKTLEDALVIAQQASEDTVSKHEDAVRGLDSSDNLALSRLSRRSSTLRSPRVFPAGSSTSQPIFATLANPKLDETSSGKGMSVKESSRTRELEKRVRDLEWALSEAEREMEEVVQRMNSAQIEVMELQNEREEAVRGTRRLQAKIEESNWGLAGLVRSVTG